MLSLAGCTGCLTKAVRQNKKAIAKSHAARIEVKAPNKISSSIDLDEAARSEYPEHARWDYLLQLTQVSKPSLTVAVEFHSIEETKILKKKKHTEAILLALCNPKPTIDRWILVPEGSTDGASRITRQKLAERGIVVSGRTLFL